MVSFVVIGEREKVNIIRIFVCDKPHAETKVENADSPLQFVLMKIFLHCPSFGPFTIIVPSKLCHPV